MFPWWIIPAAMSVASTIAQIAKTQEAESTARKDLEWRRKMFTPENIYGNISSQLVPSYIQSPMQWQETFAPKTGKKS